MEMSFYQYLMTERDPYKQDPITHFANDAFKDSMFPKHSEDYYEISRYLEMNAHYLPSMTIFDEAWDVYLSIHSKK